jgi:hypothetical protein
MRGQVEIINSKDDAQFGELSRDKVIEMATIVVRYDDAIYPDNYDQNLKTGDAGYVEAMDRFENEIDQAVLDRLGVII